MKRWVLVLVIGFGFLGVCLMWATEDSSVIKCGTKIMSYGDLCESTEGGRTVRTETYDEMKAGAEVRERVFRDHGLWVAGVGVALTGLGATMLIRRQRRRASAVAAAGQDGRPAFAQQPGFPQQQGNQQPYVQQFPPQQPQPQWQQPYSQSAGWPPQPPQGGPQQFGPPPPQQQQFGQPQPQQFGPRGQ